MLLSDSAASTIGTLLNDGHAGFSCVEMEVLDTQERLCCFIFDLVPPKQYRSSGSMLSERHTWALVVVVPCLQEALATERVTYKLSKRSRSTFLIQMPKIQAQFKNRCSGALSGQVRLWSL